MPTDVGSWFQQGPGNSGSSLGQVSDEPLTWTVADAVTVGAASGTLVAAATGIGRLVGISVPNTATGGVHINLGGGAATTNKYLLQPGDRIFIPTEQAITAIRAGASDVTVYTMVGVA